MNLTEKKREIAKRHLFELLERTVRNYIHIQDIEGQLFFLGRGPEEAKVSFIHEYEAYLLEIFSIIGEIYKRIRDAKNIKSLKILLTAIIVLIKELNDFHETKLTHLPKPFSPVELKRFGRLVKKQIDELDFSKKTTNKNTQISIFLDESITERVYGFAPLVNQHRNLCLVTNYLKINISGGYHHAKNENVFNIHIPRIEITNPCRWPSIIHEVSHKIYSQNEKKLFKKRDGIWQDFFSNLDNKEQEQLLFIKKSFAKEALKRGKKSKQLEPIKLDEWLLECWCDLFACILAGPAFWFSQNITFLYTDASNKGKISKTHPPSSFRLRLIYDILDKRFKDTMFPELKSIIRIEKDCLKEREELLDCAWSEDPLMLNLFVLFKKYFFSIFFKGGTNKINLHYDPLNTNLKKFLKYTDRINKETIDEHLISLKQGLPIPSKKCTNSYLFEFEEESYLQEIILSAWMHRNTFLYDEVLKNLLAVTNDKPNSYKDCFENTFIKIFRRFDDAILKSIQVSECIDILSNKENLYKTPVLKWSKKENALFEKYKNEGLNTLCEKIKKPRVVVFEKLHPLKNNVEEKDKLQIQTGALVDYEIYQLIQSKTLRIIPIINLSTQLGSTSVDVRLGNSFQFFYPNQVGIIDFIQKRTLDYATSFSRPLDVDIYDDGIAISPGQFLLGHTMEYIKLPPFLSAEIEGRSSFARLGLEVHMTAGFVDPGFEGVLTLEFFNAGPNPIKLYPGLRIGQLKFIPVNQPATAYDNKHTAKYKGLLTHNHSLHFKDDEIQRLRKILEEKE